jgi:hypothetical protein
VRAGYTYINGDIHRYLMSRRTQITFTDRQHAFLMDESVRSGLSMAELVRRAVDLTFRPQVRPKLRGVEVSLGVWSRPDAALLGRRPPRRRVTDDV